MKLLLLLAVPVIQNPPLLKNFFLNIYMQVRAEIGNKGKKFCQYFSRKLAFFGGIPPFLKS